MGWRRDAAHAWAPQCPQTPEIGTESPEFAAIVTQYLSLSLRHLLRSLPSLGEWGWGWAGDDYPAGDCLLLVVKVGQGGLVQRWSCPGWGRAATACQQSTANCQPGPTAALIHCGLACIPDGSQDVSGSDSTAAVQHRGQQGQPAVVTESNVGAGEAAGLSWPCHATHGYPPPLHKAPPPAREQEHGDSTGAFGNSGSVEDSHRSGAERCSSP